jgi:hypothetical protein
MTTIKWRASARSCFRRRLALVFWLEPNLEPAMLGGNTMVAWGAVFAVFWFYLVVQGYPVSHGDIGSSSTHNLDNIISSLRHSSRCVEFSSVSLAFGVYPPLTS